MGRQAKIKRARRETRTGAGAGAPGQGRTMVLTLPLPGAAHLAGDDGHFDDCEICRAMRAGDEAAAAELVRNHPNRVDGSTLQDLDLTPFIAWLKAQGIDPDALD